MKKIAIISGVILTATTIFTACSSKREPGYTYMPDMGTSRAYETYAERDSAKFISDPNDKGGKIFYNARSVAGTIKRGEVFPFPLPYDTNAYKISATIKNPIDTISSADLAEAGRLFNINCAICHGAKGTGNGPLSANIGGIANLTLPDYVKMADGTMFYSVHYGKNLMGSYASQLDARQRWAIIKYIRTLQPKPEPAAGAIKTDSTSTKASVPVKTDSTAKKA